MKQLPKFWRSSLRQTVLGIFCALVFASCSYPRALDPIFATRAGKYRMLNDSVSKFHRSLNWGEPGEAVEFVAPDFQGAFVEKVLGPAVGNRITEIRLEKIDFPPSEDSTAYAYSTVRFYGPPSIEVRAHSVKQTWNYSRLEGSWQLTDAAETELKNRDPGAMGGFIR